MRPFKFAHAADLHLDSPFAGLRTVAPEVGGRLRRAPFDAARRLVDLCLQEEVDFLVLAGDLYDGADRSLRAQLFLREQLGRLAAARIPTFIVHGNHDPTDGWSANLDWPDGVHIFPAEQVTSVPVWLQADDESRTELARVYGVSHGHARVRENLARRFRRDDDAPYAVALLHADVDGAGGSEHHPYAPCKLSDLVNSEFDYWALGHIHTRAILHPAKPVVAYPGNSQGRSRRESGPRGCLIVDVASNGETTTRFVETDAVRWETEAVSIDGIEREQELLDRLDDCVERVRERTFERRRSALLRIRIEGRGSLHSVVRRGTNREELLEQLRHAGTSGDVFTWVDSLDVRTAPGLDEEALVEDPEFLGDFVRLVRRNREALKETNAAIAATAESTATDEEAASAELDAPESMSPSGEPPAGERRAEGSSDNIDVGVEHYASPGALMRTLEPLFESRRAKRYLDRISADELEQLLIEAERLGVELLLGEGGNGSDEP